jgi:DNA-binding HxlR family transcriptional regulator
MQRTDDADRAMRHLLDRLGEKWTAHTLAVLGKGPKRFGELRREVGGVSQKVLTERVRSLERDGFLSRQVLARAPPQVEYRLTPLGRSLALLLNQIRDWADAHMTEEAPPLIAHGDVKRSESPSRRANGESGFEGEAQQCGNEPRPLD